MKALEHWTNQDDTSTSWYWRLSFWRVELQLTAHRHTYPKNPNFLRQGYQRGDRWVFQPHLTYDRKRVRLAQPTNPTPGEE